MKTTLLILFGLAGGTLVSQAQDNAYLKEMQARLERAKTYTLQVAQAMPEDQYDYQPTADEMSFRGQLLHIAQNMIWLTSTYLTTRPNPLTNAMTKDTGQSKAEVEQTVGRAFDYAIEAVRRFDPGDLEQTVAFFAGPLSKRQIMQLVNDHQTHHRGQLIVYLRLKAVKPPAYVGW